MAKSIHITILDGDLGDGFDELAAAAYMYADLLEQKVSALFPGADVTVDVVENTTGWRPRPSIEWDGELGRESEIQECVRAIEERAWDEFLSTYNKPRKK